jgi:hypothetical protein
LSSFSQDLTHDDTTVDAMSQAETFITSTADNSSVSSISALTVSSYASLVNDEEIERKASTLYNSLKTLQSGEDMLDALKKVFDLGMAILNSYN